ncbi:hypothetical protein F4821DRAFT_189471 [Hypoxylon rubiginosum]|uniref:Uncharacterized protein n=1 Tax=Hypoxylon rubiginosum TaxID=110542 RepID=A0ACC0DFV5_9PEZI|nr:hypothetical protein F4821DRAFT_189471 [Hypoxylon rubiginosum]
MFPILLLGVLLNRNELDPLDSNPENVILGDICQGSKRIKMGIGNILKFTSYVIVTESRNLPGSSSHLLEFEGGFEGTVTAHQWFM